MKNLLKGGMDTIIVVILLIALVVALFTVVILPYFQPTIDFGSGTQGRINDIADEINGVFQEGVEEPIEPI